MGQTISEPEEYVDYYLAYRYQRCHEILCQRGRTETDTGNIDELEALVANTAFVIDDFRVMLTFKQEVFTLANVRVEPGERWGNFYNKWLDPVYAPLNVKLYNNGIPIHDNEYVALTTNFKTLSLEIGMERIGGSFVDYHSFVPASDGFKEFLMTKYKTDKAFLRQLPTGMQWVCYTTLSTVQKVDQVVYHHRTFWVLLLPFE